MEKSFYSVYCAYKEKHKEIYDAYTEKEDVLLARFWSEMYDAETGFFSELFTKYIDRFSEITIVNGKNLSYRYVVTDNEYDPQMTTELISGKRVAITLCEDSLITPSAWNTIKNKSLEVEDLVNGRKKDTKFTKDELQKRKVELLKLISDCEDDNKLSEYSKELKQVMNRLKKF